MKAQWGCIRRAFWCSCGHRAARDLSNRLRFQQLRRLVTPRVLEGALLWPPTKRLLSSVDRYQRVLLAACRRIEPLPGEDPASFARRRGRIAGATAREHGLWSAAIRSRQEAWLEHLRRASEMGSLSWASLAISTASCHWLRERRTAHGTPSLGGRIQARARLRRVQGRWEDTVCRELGLNPTLPQPPESI